MALPLLEGKPVSQVLEATGGPYPRAYVLKDEHLYNFEDPAILDYYDVQDPHEDTIVYDYVEEAPVKSNYEFAYGVEDDKHGTSYSRKESSDGKGTKGQYQVHLPDGRIQTVIYSADEHGYRAQVMYEGEAVHDEPKSHPNAIPHSTPIRKLEKEQKIHALHEETPVYQGSGQHIDTNAYFGSRTLPFEGHHSPHLNIGHHTNALHSFPHVTDIPYSPVAPSSAPLGQPPFATAPFHSTVPHPHPLVNSHGAHAIHNLYERSVPQLRSISDEVAKAAKAVNRPLFRGDVKAKKRLTRGIEINKDSTAVPFLKNKE